MKISNEIKLKKARYGHQIDNVLDWSEAKKKQSQRDCHHYTMKTINKIRGKKIRNV